jgi:TolA-binding protein
MFTISVDRLRPNQRFALQLPDGELEVRGTRFIVRVDAQHTLGVAVEEGHVALRLRGHVETMLGPGEAWPAVTPPSAPAAQSAVAPSKASPFHARGALVKVDSAVPSGSANAVGPSSTANAPPATAAEEFARAMSSFSRADYGTAEQLLDAFDARHPGSAHAEDVLFLRALTRSRRGDEQGAGVLARTYLHRYPAGFRREEAEQLSEGASRK